MMAKVSKYDLDRANIKANKMYQEKSTRRLLNARAKREMLAEQQSLQNRQNNQEKIERIR